MKVVLMLLIFVSAPAFSWDAIVKGKISTIDAVTGDVDNRELRVTLIGAPALCGSTHTWAYANTTDSNYNFTASLLLAAKLADKEVEIYSNRDSSTFCHIGYTSLK
jgi:hypothetical protein